MIFGEKGKKERLGRPGGRVRGGEICLQELVFHGIKQKFLFLYIIIIYFVVSKMTPICMNTKEFVESQCHLLFFLILSGIVLNLTTVLISTCVLTRVAKGCWLRPHCFPHCYRLCENDIKHWMCMLVSTNTTFSDGGNVLNFHLYWPARCLPVQWLLSLEMTGMTRHWSFHFNPTPAHVPRENYNSSGHM